MQELGGSIGRPHVFVRGDRFREVRAASGLRLADVAAGVPRHIATISRLETAQRKNVEFDLIVSLTRQLGIPISETVTPKTWASEIGRQAIEFMTRWRFEEGLRTLLLRDAVEGRRDPQVDVQAHILTRWVQHTTQGLSVPEEMRQWAERARDIGAQRAAVWATVIEGAMRDHLGDETCSLETLAGAAHTAERDGEPADVLSAHAAWARVLLKRGHTTHGLEVLGAVAGLVSSSSLYGQARFLHARGLLYAAAGSTEDAERSLKGALAGALELRNYRMAALIERALADAYEQRGDTVAADAALVRGASWCAQAGDGHGMWEALAGALRHHGPADVDLTMILSRVGGGKSRVHSTAEEGAQAVRGGAEPCQQKGGSEMR